MMTKYKRGRTTICYCQDSPEYGTIMYIYEKYEKLIDKLIAEGKLPNSKLKIYEDKLCNLKKRIDKETEYAP